MNDSEAKALGLRAVACKGWRWMRGMVIGPDGWQVVMQNADALASEGLELAHRDGRWSMDPEQVAGVGPFADDGPRWPEFRDPATLGCLLALVREAWGMWIGVRESPALVGPPIYAAHSHRHYATEAEALVAALEAAAARVPQ